MSKNYSKKRRLKYVLLAAACTASFSLTGLAAACKTDENKDETTKTPTREDTQLLKNGDFEFFDVPAKNKDENAPVYLINSPNNWSHGGTSSYTMSGIIGTAPKAWNKLSAPSLAGDLDYNNALDSSASDYKDKYIDYNGMKSSDVLYKDTYAALNESSIDDWTSYFGITEDNGKFYYDGKEVYRKTEGEGDDEKYTYYFDKDLTEPISKAIIENPMSHYDVKDENGKLTYDGKDVYEDENGDYYFAYDAAKEEYSQPFSHVLMLHNYATSHNGIVQNYSSVDVTLPANTAAEISFWVKTSDLKFHQGEKVKQDRGASVYVKQTAGSSTLDDFAITCINTEKLIEEGAVPEEYAQQYNGWVEYTVYINACDFASTTVSLSLSLGDSDNPVEGYAFFDDVQVTKYASLDEEDGSSYHEYEKAIDETAYTMETEEKRNAFCVLSSDASEKIFKADSYSRNEGEVSADRFSSCFHYLIDLTSTKSSNESEGYKPVSFDGSKVGLTVDGENYVSASYYSNLINTGKALGFTSVEPLGKAKLPNGLKIKDGDTDKALLDTSKDVLAYVKAGYPFTANDTAYYNKLNEVLVGADGLPKINSQTENNMLVMLSAYGAAYTASFDLEIEKDGYQIISFWVKTSDMGGYTASTVRITQESNKDNSASFTLDTTDLTTDIDDDHKDIYDGWVQCFFFVHNDSDENEKETLTIEFSFGNTTIKDTSVSSYKAGWAALANVQTLDVDKDTFAYTGSTDHSASLTISEDTEKKTSVFDEAYGSQSHEIEKDIVNPSTYKGVNGGSSSIVNNGHVSIPFDDINTNEQAGLINKEYFEKGNYSEHTWYQSLLNSFGLKDTTKALTNWNEIFGNKSVQPLLIVNQIRESYIVEKGADKDTYKQYLVKDENGKYVKPTGDFDEKETYYSRKDVLNYGFIGSDKSVSANSYGTVSVRVKVSAGAIAYVYLADTSAGKNVLGFKTPSYSFYYDEDGNVLKGKPDPKASLEEKRKNVMYWLRDDGLYEDEKGDLFANLYNYTKLYTDESATYYNEKGEAVSFDKLVAGETYYDKAGEGRKELNHYLITASGTKIYEYDGAYHYIVDGKAQKEVVKEFSKDIARYEGFSEDYMVKIDGNDESIADKWITVNFVIHAGSESKSYRLELWSGERESTGLDENGNPLSTASKAGSTVIFDYSYTSITDDTLRNEYENDIIKAYQALLNSKDLLKDINIATSEENIGYYEELVKGYIGNGITAEEYEAIKSGYSAWYYTYSLYDSANFQPFNKETANEESTGYNYSINDYSESLAYLGIKEETDEGYVYTVFADYSTVDQSISLDTVTDDDEDEDKDEDKDNSSVWLLASSIILVIVLLGVMLSMFIRDAYKKLRRSKVVSKNNYQKTNRYIRRLGIKKEEFEEVEAPVSNEPKADNEQPAEEAGNSAEAPAEQTEESAEKPDGSQE